jgi:hypothetical protein
MGGTLCPSNEAVWIPQKLSLGGCSLPQKQILQIPMAGMIEDLQEYIAYPFLTEALFSGLISAGDMEC